MLNRTVCKYGGKILHADWSVSSLRNPPVAKKKRDDSARDFPLIVFTLRSIRPGKNGNIEINFMQYFRTSISAGRKVRGEFASFKMSLH